MLHFEAFGFYNGLDIFAIKQLNDILLECRTQGKTVILSSHIVDIVEKLSDRTIILHDSKIVGDLLLPVKDGLENAYFAMISN